MGPWAASKSEKQQGDFGGLHVEEVRGAGDHARRLAVGADEDAARLRRRRSGKAVAARKEGEVWHGGGGGGRRRRWPRAGKAKHGAAEEEVEGGGGCTQGSRSVAAERGDGSWRRRWGAAAEPELLRERETREDKVLVGATHDASCWDSA
jgi:hypothetical protein